MCFSKVIEMDIWSEFGCFSKPDSTSGGLLTYLIPPKTSIIGIIGAVLGYNFEDFEEYENNIKKYKIEELYGIKISIQPLFDLRCRKITFNRVDGTTNKTKIQNIHQDVLINPYYKIFISFPNYLSCEEELFLKRIRKNETVYSLYMGRNEFPLSYKLCNIFDYESVVITEKNCNNFFKGDEKIHGLLNKDNIIETELKTVHKVKSHENNSFFLNNGNILKLKSFYEYVTLEYPIKRTNFTDFTYSEISFYTEDNFKECYFSKFSLKNQTSVELTKIGENEWIFMI